MQDWRPWSTVRGKILVDSLTVFERTGRHEAATTPVGSGKVKADREPLPEREGAWATDSQIFLLQIANMHERGSQARKEYRASMSIS